MYGLHTPLRSRKENLRIVERALAVQCPKCKRAPDHFCTPDDMDGIFIHGARINRSRGD